eukprot:4079-Heterococcus_DN1.PRE.2
MLSNYTQYGGVALSWVMFGSSGYDKRPEGGVRNEQADGQYVKGACAASMIVFTSLVARLRITDDCHNLQDG